MIMANMMGLNPMLVMQQQAANPLIQAGLLSGAGGLGGNPLMPQAAANPLMMMQTANVTTMMQHPVMQELAVANPVMTQMLLQNPPLLAQLLQEHDEAPEEVEELPQTESRSPSVGENQNSASVGAPQVQQHQKPPGGVSVADHSGSSSTGHHPPSLADHDTSYAGQLLRKKQQQEQKKQADQKRTSLTRRNSILADFLKQSTSLGATAASGVGAPGVLSSTITQDHHAGGTASGYQAPMEQSGGPLGNIVSSGNASNGVMNNLQQQAERARRGSFLESLVTSSTALGAGLSRRPSLGGGATPMNQLGKVQVATTNISTPTAAGGAPPKNSSSSASGVNKTISAPTPSNAARPVSKKKVSAIFRRGGERVRGATA
ncbi:unnamed protein product [Amoebophrya sp. A120]|nr:unnamed protein product [Amoebophrya sp. A120]|eukprot:GSA120T00023032001.1